MSALPEGWSVFEEAGDVIIQLRPAELNSTFVLSRDELRAVLEQLAEAVASVDEEAGRELVHSRQSQGVEPVLDGWALSVENATVIVDVGPGNPGGHYVLSVQQASALWRSLAAAYWRADDQWQEELWQAFFGDADSSGGSL